MRCHEPSSEELINLASIIDSDGSVDNEKNASTEKQNVGMSIMVFPEDGGDTFLQSIDSHQQDYTASQPRRQ
jgi:hypothetical protein